MTPDIATDVWSRRRVLVTGATGMVGSWLSRWLVEAGAHVVALVMDHDPQSDLLRSGISARLSVVDGRIEHYEDVERPEGQCLHCEEVSRPDPRGVEAQEGPPAR